MHDASMEDIDTYIDEVWEDVVADIAALVAHPSVADASASEPAAPFGRPVRAALDCALAIAERLGYDIGEDEGYIGFADIAGERSAHIATIAHIDVVPAGPGWTGDPYRMRRREGWLLGRGVIDDKGPAVLALYAGAYLLRAGITPRYAFRALIGCDEEMGMTDVRHYLESHEQPLFLFTPDAEFPVCNAEKGCFGATFVSAPITGGVIHSWSGAEATNAIPGESVCVLAIPASDLPLPADHPDRVLIEDAGGGSSRIVAHGIGGHASLPQGTINAISLIVGYLRQVAEELPARFPSPERSFLELLCLIHEGTAGEGLGIEARSDTFGELTCNAGTIEVASGRISQTIDVRYPDSITCEEMSMICRAHAARYGAQFVPGRMKEPFFISPENPAIQTLLTIYREVTGKPAAPFSMGGGTYARNFACAVSFGPEDGDLALPAWAGIMHGPDEAVGEQLLRDALKMYILAILRLNELEL